MSRLFVGDPAKFAIESYIGQAFERLSQRALGYFVIHVAGQVYGVRAPDATLLACSFDAVSRRLDRRGSHAAGFGIGMAAEELARSVHAVLYEDGVPERGYLGLSAEELSRELVANDIQLAPDGDAAFDDGSNILQFDLGEQVRLIAFKNSDNAALGVESLAEITMDAVEFYQVLESWLDQFEATWRAALDLRG